MQQGCSTCSVWGKIEIELLAWAYVIGMARDGDTWHEVTPLRCMELLTQEERNWCGHYLKDVIEGYRADMWKTVVLQLKDADGAFGVGGTSWGKGRFMRMQEETV